MKYRIVVSFAALLFAVGALTPAAVFAQETQDTMQLTSELRTTRSALTDAYGRLAIDDIAAHYADDIFVQFGTDEFRGKEAASAWISQALQGLAALRFGRSSFTIKPDEVTERNSYTVVLPDGNEQTGTVETVWKKQAPGGWKISRMLVL